ncbi:hypothetical protein TNCV_1835061 [Trichonephila clavipes]|nr:hypothetical protein TNCV_1835061 [Trichonephila clavipes]
MRSTKDQLIKKGVLMPDGTDKDRDSKINDSVHPTVLSSSQNHAMPVKNNVTVTAGSDVVQSGRPIFDDFFQHLWPYVGNNTANVVFRMVKRLWLIRIDQ